MNRDEVYEKFKLETNCVSAPPPITKCYKEKEKTENKARGKDEWLSYPFMQFLLQQLVLLQEQSVRLISRAKLRRQFITFALHPVQLDAQRLTQLFVRRRVCLKGAQCV